MSKKTVSILVVSLNPGEKLLITIKSILEQSFEDYQVIIKDGGSKDGSLARLREYLDGQSVKSGERIRIIEKQDTGIYDGMNQATAYAEGEYFYFLNCGDVFYSKEALKELAQAIEKDASVPGIYYGNIYDMLRKQVVTSNPKIDAFACYRNIPCHQACLYHNSLFKERGYETKYRVRADYEHFLWCYFHEKAKMQYVDMVLASYEGGGFSETAENSKISRREHEEITGLYMSRGQIFRYKMILALTLAPLRTKMAESKTFAGFYQKVKKVIYRQ